MSFIADTIQIQPMLMLNPPTGQFYRICTRIQIQPMLMLNGVSIHYTFGMSNSNTTYVNVKPL